MSYFEDVSKGVLIALLSSCQTEPPISTKPAQTVPTTRPKEQLEIQAQLDALTSKVRGCLFEQRSVSVVFSLEASGVVRKAKVFDLLQESPAALCIESILVAERFKTQQTPIRVVYTFSGAPRIELESSIVNSPVTQSAASQSQPIPQSLPADATAALLEAQRLFALGNVNDAEKALAPFLVKPLPEMLYLLGGIAQHKGNVVEMCSYFNQYLRASPQSAAAASLQKQVNTICK